MDKYTIGKRHPPEMLIPVYWESFEHAYFVKEEHAQEYIAWKNQPRIDKNIKRVVLEGLENKKDNYEIEINNGHKEEYITKKFKQYESAIEIISNLKETE